MCSIKIKLLTLAAVVLISVSLQAQEGYLGANLGFFNYSESGIDDEAVLQTLNGRLGLSFNRNFSGEIRVGFGTGDDSVRVLNTDVNVELDNMYGAYARGSVPISEVISPYAVLGYTRGKVTASASGFGSTSLSESDVSFGIGVDINIAGDFVLNFEYMNYLDKDGAEISGVSGGVVIRF